MLIALNFIAGLIVLSLGADWLVKGASRLAMSFGISALVVGLTVVALGTSAPEMTVGIVSSLKGEADLVMGNVIGSNIFNVLFILGLSALIIPLRVARQLIRLDVPIMIAASGLVWLLARDGSIGKIEGAFLVLCLLAYMALLLHLSRKGRYTAAESSEIPDEFETALAENPKASAFLRSRLFQVLLVLAGMLALVLGSRLFVSAAVDLARLFGVSELLIGLTIVAAGTSLPEVATSIMAAFRGERDIAVGNVVGSNIFNLLGALGAAALVSSTGLSVSETVLSFDIHVMIATAVATLPIFLTGHVIKRWEGGVFLAYYVAYTGMVVFAAMDHPELSTLQVAITYFAAPLTMLTISIGLYRHFRREKRARAN